MRSALLSSNIAEAVHCIKSGGVIAYPTEYCFGLGCNPENKSAVERILAIKNRKVDQGLILIAADNTQVNEYADLDVAKKYEDINQSWPGGNTWLLRAKSNVPKWITGQHEKLAIRVPGHQFCRELCQLSGSAIVSTSANRSGEMALLTAELVHQAFKTEVDLVVDLMVDGAEKPSIIRDGNTGAILRI